MSTTLKEFLQQEAQKHRNEENAAKETVQEWQSAIMELFDQVRTWLNAADPQGVIEIEQNQEEIREPGLGRYRLPRLDLRAFGKWIGIIPKARKTVGQAQPFGKKAPERAQGRVDITDELRRYVLYRFQENGKNTWMIDGLERGYDATEKSWPGEVRYNPLSEIRPLDQETLERALMSYLQ